MPPFSTPLDPHRLGFDIDGVIADTCEAFLRLAAREYGRIDVTIEDITAFDVVDCLDMDAGDINAIFARLMTDPLAEGLKPMPYAPLVLGELARKAPLTFITARPLHEPIDRWLHAILDPSTYRKTRLIAMGEHDGKKDFITNLGLHYFIDDRAETCQQLAADGLAPIVFEQPWNRGKHQLPSVDNWLAIWRLCFDA